MEERWFKSGNASPVEEGEMTLQVAKLLAEKLRSLGARVSFVREKPSLLRRTGPLILRRRRAPF